VAASVFILPEWKKQQQVFLKNLVELRTKEQPDAIHDLRVATKKLRSYLKLLSLLFKKNDYKAWFKKTEYLFSVLGKHRDIEVGLSLLKVLEKENKTVYRELKSHLEAARNQAAVWVKAAVKNYDGKEIENLAKEIEIELYRKDSGKLSAKAKAIIEKELATVQKLAEHLSRQAHRVRKLLKDIFYWAVFSPKDSLLDSDKIKKCKKIMEQLGDWQDHEMLLRKVKHFRKDFVPDAKEEYALLKMLQNNIENKMNTILDDADKNIKSLFT
jgi:CHAD domain-containing protein